MEKKIYEKPTMTVVKLQPAELLSGSAPAGAKAKRIDYENGNPENGDNGQVVESGVWKWMN